MSASMKEIINRIDELDTFLIESGFERYNDMELVSYFKNSSGETTKVTTVVSEPNYNKGFQDE